MDFWPESQYSHGYDIHHKDKPQNARSWLPNTRQETVELCNQVLGTSMADGERDNLVFEKYVVMFIDYYGCLPASTYSAYSNKAENEL